jgi:hypothetical protein
VLYVYAIVERAPLADLTGLQGATVQSVESEGLAAVATAHGALESPLSQDHLWTHEEVVESLMEQMPVLPMRAGTTVADDGVLRDLLRTRAPEFRRALDRVRGAVELGVRTAVPSREQDERGRGSADDSGTAYLRAKLEDQAALEHSASVIHAALRRLARDHASLSAPPDRGQTKSAYLVDRDTIDRFLDRVESLGAEIPGASIVCTGPWPPYSFVGESR